MKTTETELKIIEMRANNISFDKIAKKLHISKKTAIEKTKSLADDINNLRQSKLDELQKKHQLLKEHRLKKFGKMLNKLNNEIEKRDFTDLPTDKLFEIYLKVNTQYLDEFGKLEFVKTKKEDGYNLKQKWDTN